MTFGSQIVQIYCSDKTPLGRSLAAVVSTVKGCFARVDSRWPNFENSNPWGTDVFLVMVQLDPEDRNERESQLDSLRRYKKLHRFPEFILISNELTLEQQKQLLEAHATELMESPIDLQRLTYLIDSRRIEHAHWLKQNRSTTVCSDDSQSKLQQKIKKIANVATNILLSGETGVGKTFMAQKIHRASKRAKHPFVVVDCASIPTNLIESELFGHAKGAFTDACSKKIGQFEYVGAGTILLDEIDSLSPTVQAKLLRVVENHEFRRVGENSPIAMKARIISATNLDLEHLVEQKQFRADLFFRLNAYEIRIPNLSERKEEIEPLCHLFAEEFARENEQVRKTFTANAMKVMCQYDWPGNLRELRNCVFHGAIDSADNVIRVSNLPEKLVCFREAMTEAMAEAMAESNQGFSIASQLAEKRPVAENFDAKIYQEAKRLVLALEHNSYNRSLTAKELGVSRMTIYNMMKRHHFG